MKLITKIACRTIGTAGIAAACYDAFQVSKHYTKSGAENAMGSCPDKDFFSSEKSEDTIKNDNTDKKKTGKTYSKSNMPVVINRTKCRVKGFIYGLSDALPIAICSAVAIVCKTGVAVAGAIGVGAAALYKIAQENSCDCEKHIKS